MSALGAIFVGGASRRMGGFPKGRLVAPSGERIVTRLAGIFASLGVRCALVGDASSYGDSGLRVIADAVPGQGPLGGLIAALADGDPVLAVACDMPHLSEGLIARLLAAPPELRIVAPVARGVPQPLCARYAASVLDVARARLARGALSLQGLLAEVEYAPLDLTPGEASLLVDWDEPGDVRPRDARK